MTQSLLATEYLEVTASDQTTTQLATEYLEVTASDQTTTQLATIYIEVLTPAIIPTPVFVGWGVQI